MQAKPSLIGIGAPPITEKTIIEFVLWGMTAWFMKRSINKSGRPKEILHYILLKISVKITSNGHCNANWTHIQPLIAFDSRYKVSRYKQNIIFLPQSKSDSKFRTTLEN